MALGLNTCSAYFLIRSVISMSVTDIAELSKSKWGFSSQVADNLTHQRSDTIVGFTLLLISILVGMINLLWPISWVDFDINYAGVCTGIVISLIIFFISAKISNRLHRTSYEQVIDILNNKSEDVSQICLH